MKRRRAFFCFALMFALLSACAISTERGQNSLPEVFQQVSPSVVVILTSESGYSIDKPGETSTSSGLGSGVVISQDGSIMTAAHVIQVADVVHVKLYDGTIIPASIVGSADLADVALIKLEKVPSNLVAAELGNSDNVRVGEAVFVVGSPYGIERTLTVGYISGRRRPKNFSEQLIPMEFLQTDAAVNTGNSGGPMFNMEGEVIGIVSSILSKSGGFEGVGFAASINIAKELLLRRKSFWTGLEGYLLTGPLAKALNVPQEAGFLIQRVAANSPGYFLGLEPSRIPMTVQGQEILIGGDIVLEVQGIKVSPDLATLRKIREIVQEQPVLSRTNFKVLRGSKIVNLPLSD
jgi:S1-C subfamily serine protease